MQNTGTNSQMLIVQNAAQEVQSKVKLDHKEVIVNHIRKYIKGNKITDVVQQKQSNKTIEDQEQTEEIVENLRDFLTYLEGKNIINSQKLQDKEEMKNLLKDIMKLDLTKFSQR